jgi:hypothetical protein
MRRATLTTAVCLLAVTSVLVTAGPASANKPTQISNRAIGFVCSDVRTSDGVIQVAVEDFSENNEPDGSINYWVPPETPENAPDSTYRSSSLITDQHVTRTGYHFEGTLVMEDRDFNPVGTATFSVDMIATSSPEDIGGKSKEGNRNIHDDSTLQFFSISGSVTLHDGKVFDLTDCIGPDGAPSDRAGRDFITDFRITDPSQFVLNNSGILVLCDVATDTYSMNLGASSEKASTGGAASLFTEDGAMGGETSSGISLSKDAFTGTIPITDSETGEPLGDAIINVTFTRGERTSVRESNGSVRSTITGFLLNPTGTITFPTVPPTSVDMSSCFALDGRRQQKEHRPSE